MNWDDFISIWITVVGITFLVAGILFLIVVVWSYAPGLLIGILIFALVTFIFSFVIYKIIERR